MTYRLIIVDDEPLARTRLQRLLEDQSGFEVVAELESGQACLDWLESQSADAVLLDIQMPGLTGLETAARIQLLEKPPVVIFCTAYDEHALDAFGVKAIDYLLKPVRREDLQRSLSRASEWLQHNGNDATSEDAARSHLTARTHMGLQLIPIDDVFYFTADQKYVNVVHTEGETLIDDSLRQLEDEFGERFVRVHRSALVARNRIERLGSVEGSGHQVYLRGLRDGVSVSRRHLADVRRVMKSM
ncbi:MAG: DNA-binding response regulator [Oceanospirillaceae bacterium]|nr:DNA-binding response regulator [Oceanospirillaceae bacterium]|tara:strand:+ start:706 stop:1437 length:732 start_codon:yes stop_codon:yes gene_type:complete